MEVGELREVSRSIAAQLGASVGGLREATREGNKNLSHMIKDIANMFSAQSQNVSSLSSSMEESLSETTRSSGKLDAVSSLLSDSIAVQHNMLGELRMISFNIRNLAMSLNGNNGGGLGGMISKGAGMIGGAVGGAALGAGAGYMLGGGGDAQPIPAHGDLATNQKEAYNAAKSELPSSGAKILVANMSGESLANPSNKHWDRTHYSQGIVQWDDNRSRKIKEQFGKYPIEMTVAEQTKAAMWEMKTFYKKAWDALNNEKLSNQERMYAVVSDYERPQHPEADTMKRLGYLAGLKVDDGKETTKPEEKSSSGGGGIIGSASAQETGPQSSPMSSGGGGGQKPPETAMSYAAGESHGGGEHGGGHHPPGIISGANKPDLPAKPGVDTERLNKGIVDKFQQIAGTVSGLSISSGYRSPERNARAGGAKNSAHMRGNAVDVTFNGGIPQTLKLIETASKAGIGGIGVYQPGVLHFDTESKRAWGPSYGRNSVPEWAEHAIKAHESNQWGNYDPNAKGSGVDFESGGLRNPGGPIRGGSMGYTPGDETNFNQISGGQVMPQNPISNIGSMIGGQFGGGMGAMAGGLIGSLASSAISNLMQQDNAITIPQQDMSAYSPVDKNNQEIPVIREKDLYKPRVIEQNQLQRDTQPQVQPQSNDVKNIGMETQNTQQGKLTGNMGPNEYNNHGEVGWPSWVSQLGGWHWDEFKSVKLNMWNK